MREAAQSGAEMTPQELVRTFYETVVSQHRLEDLPRFVGEDCVLRQGEPYVVSECVMEGTHLGPWPGPVPTGKRLTFTGVNIDRVEGGKIVEHGGAVNTFETLWDAGIIRPTNFAF